MRYPGYFNLISISFQSHFNLISISTQSHLNLISISFQSQLNLNSISFQSHFNLNSISFQSHFNLNSISTQSPGYLISIYSLYWHAWFRYSQLITQWNLLYFHLSTKMMTLLTILCVPALQYSVCRVVVLYIC